MIEFPSPGEKPTRCHNNLMGHVPPIFINDSREMDPGERNPETDVHL